MNINNSMIVAITITGLHGHEQAQVAENLRGVPDRVRASDNKMDIHQRGVQSEGGCSGWGSYSIIKLYII